MLFFGVCFVLYFIKLSAGSTKHVQSLVEPILKLSIFKLKSLFIPCKFNIM